MRQELDFVVTEMYSSGIAYTEAVQQFRRSFLLGVLSAHGGNQCKAAAALGMHRNTMHRMIHALAIDPAEVRLDAKRSPRRACTAVGSRRRMIT